MSALFKKLNLGTIQRVLVLKAPESFQVELDQLDDVQILTNWTTKTRTEFAIGFACTESERDKVSAKLVAAADGDAVIWLAYPKKSSKNYACEFNRDSSWQVFGDAGFEGVRQVAIDEDWSALRFRRTDKIKSITRDASRAISKSGQDRSRK